jgi:glycosyltransferase involved in cell wall biosynthesis
MIVPAEARLPEPDFLPGAAFDAVETLGQADIVVGIPSYNNAATIGHVTRAAQAGLERYFPQLKAVVINSDGGSSDGTREAVLASRLDSSQLLLFKTPRFPIHRPSFPYHGIPGKGSAFRLIFQMASMLGARGCVVIDSDLRSITPEWIDLLLRPVLHAGFDFTAPFYHRHKYDGTITNGIVYPLTRALYGLRVRQPIGGDFGLSARMLKRYLSRRDWQGNAARYGIDLWMTTIAIAEGYRVCQSFLGAKLHGPKDPGADLSEMLHQVVGSVFALMQEYESVWKSTTSSRDVDLFGFRFGVGLDPVEVNTGRMLGVFHRATRELREVWALALQPATLKELSKVSSVLAADSRNGFHLDDELWVRVVMDFAVAWHEQPAERNHILRSLTSLYLARVASFVLETRDLLSDQVEERIERLCLTFQRLKPYLRAGWDHSPSPGEFIPRKAGGGAAGDGDGARLEE